MGLRAARSARRPIPPVPLRDHPQLLEGLPQEPQSGESDRRIEEADGRAAEGLVTSTAMRQSNFAPMAGLRPAIDVFGAVAKISIGEDIYRRIYLIFEHFPAKWEPVRRRKRAQTQQGLGSCMRSGVKRVEQPFASAMRSRRSQRTIALSADIGEPATPISARAITSPGTLFAACAQERHHSAASPRRSIIIRKTSMISSITSLRACSTNSDRS